MKIDAAAYGVRVTPHGRQVEIAVPTLDSPDVVNWNAHSFGDVVDAESRSLPTANERPEELALVVE
ncbi:hypothetical protein ACW9PK_12075 [Kocuria sp. MNB10]